MGTRHVTAVDGLIAERVRAYRKQSGLSQMQLGERLGVTFQQIQKYEAGTNRIGAGRLFEIAAVFDVPIQILYPESETSRKDVKNSTADMKAIPDFVLTADGWRLCRSFLQIKDPKLRKKVITLVIALTEP